jgi:hypothetical protein
MMMHDRAMKDSAMNVPMRRWRTQSECPGRHHHLYLAIFDHESIFVTNRFGGGRHGFFQRSWSSWPCQNIIRRESCPLSFKVGLESSVIVAADERSAPENGRHLGG